MLYVIHQTYIPYISPLNSVPLPKKVLVVALGECTGIPCIPWLYTPMTVKRRIFSYKIYIFYSHVFVSTSSGLNLFIANNCKLTDEKDIGLTARSVRCNAHADHQRRLGQIKVGRLRPNHKFKPWHCIKPIVAPCGYKSNVRRQRWIAMSKSQHEA